MITFTLIISMYAGLWSRGDSVALTHIEGFKSKQSCEVAGNSAKTMANETKKDIKFVCVEMK